MSESANLSRAEGSRTRSRPDAPVDRPEQAETRTDPGARPVPESPLPDSRSARGWARGWGGATRLGAGVVRHGATILHVLSLAAAFVVLLHVDRRMWFRVDDFEFLAKRGLHGATLSIWYPHDEHWSTIPILAYRALFTMFGIRTAKPYLVLLFVAHLTLTHLLWRAMRAWGVQPAVATALAAVFALLGAGGTDILWAFQIGYVGSLLLGWAFILLVNHDKGFGWRDVIGSLVAIAALMSSGVGGAVGVVGGVGAGG